GIVILSAKFFMPTHKISQYIQIEREKIFQVSITLFCFLFLSIVFDKELTMYFSVMWIFPFLSVIPLETLFQAILRLRSKRNFLYLLYILICLLDSHVEGRFKIITRLFEQ